MTDTARPAAEAAIPLPDLFLYGRAGCHLCDEARTIVAALLAERVLAGRPTPTLVERDVTTDATWERDFLATIPVLELGGRRLELATSPSRIRRFLEEP